MRRVLIAAVVLGVVAIAKMLPDAPPSDAATLAPAVAVNVFSINRGSAGVAIKNTTSARLASVFLHCTFRTDAGYRIDSVPVFVADLASGDTANKVAKMPNDIKAAKVDCLTEYANKG